MKTPDVINFKTAKERINMRKEDNVVQLEPLIKQAAKSEKEIMMSINRLIRQLPEGSAKKVLNESWCNEAIKLSLKSFGVNL